MLQYSAKGKGATREYLMIFGVPVFLAGGRLDASPTPFFSRQQVVSLSQSSCVSPVAVTDGKGGGGGAKPHKNDGEKAWSFTTFNTLWAQPTPRQDLPSPVEYQLYSSSCHFFESLLCGHHNTLPKEECFCCVEEKHAGTGKYNLFFCILYIGKH